MRELLRRRARRRIPRARPAKGNRSARRESADAPGRPPTACRAAARADPAPPARSRSPALRRGSRCRARRARCGRCADRAAAARARVPRASACAPRRSRRARQQLVAVGDRARRRRLEERKRVDRRRGRAPPCAGSPTRASCAGSRGRCMRGRPRNRPPRTGARRCRPARDRCGRRAASPPPARSSRCRSCVVLLRSVVALDAREPGVDHVADARHGERRFRDVRREHDAPALRRREDALLLLHREPRVERQDLDRVRVRSPRERAAREVAGLADLALARKEHEDVAGTFAPQVLGGRHDRVLERFLVVGIAGADVIGAAERPVAHLDRIQCVRRLRSPARACRRVPKWRAKRSASIVADVMISLSSGRRASSCFR